MVTNDCEAERGSEAADDEDDTPLSEAERQKMFEAAKSAITRTS